METKDVVYFRELGFQSSSVKTSCGAEVFAYHRNITHRNGKTPILVLIHGYPESSYMWRHVATRIPEDVPLFVPDIPGYGRSSPSETSHDKGTIGAAILEALRSLVGSSDNLPIIIAGHDRGGRICHRLAVDASQRIEGFVIQAAILLDIIPTLSQWEALGDSKTCAGSFHWPLLANVEIATNLIKAQGGDVWCNTMMRRWAGKTEEGFKNLTSGDSLSVYSHYFAQESVIRASNEDYRAGAFDDIDLQKKDQEHGPKISIDTLVIYSANYLGSRFDVKSIWSHWVSDPKYLKFEGIGGGIGHFMAEEAPDQTSSAIVAFIKSVM